MAAPASQKLPVAIMELFLRLATKEAPALEEKIQELVTLRQLAAQGLASPEVSLDQLPTAQQLPYLVCEEQKLRDELALVRQAIPLQERAISCRIQADANVARSRASEILFEAVSPTYNPPSPAGSSSTPAWTPSP